MASTRTSENPVYHDGAALYGASATVTIPEHCWDTQTVGERCVGIETPQNSDCYGDFDPNKPSKKAKVYAIVGSTDGYRYATTYTAENAACLADPDAGATLAERGIHCAFNPDFVAAPSTNYIRVYSN